MRLWANLNLFMIIMLVGLAFVPQTEASAVMNGSNWTGLDYLDNLNGRWQYDSSHYSDFVSRTVNNAEFPVSELREGNYTNIGVITPSAKDGFMIRGAGIGKTILKANPANSVLFDYTTGSKYIFEDLSIDCMGIATCINFAHTSSGNYQGAMSRVEVYNATTLINLTNWEEMVIDHSIIGDGSGHSDYGIVIVASGGTVRSSNNLYQQNVKSGVKYSATTQFSSDHDVWTGGGSEGQFQLSGGGGRVTISEPWFESPTTENIKVTGVSNPKQSLTIQGNGYFQTGNAYNNINGSFQTLEILGSPSFVSPLGVNNLNVSAVAFNAPLLVMNRGINNQEGNSTWYWYSIADGTIHTNISISSPTTTNLNMAGYNIFNTTGMTFGYLDNASDSYGAFWYAGNGTYPHTDYYYWDIVGRRFRVIGNVGGAGEKEIISMDYNTSLNLSNLRAEQDTQNASFRDSSLSFVVPNATALVGTRLNATIRAPVNATIIEGSIDSDYVGELNVSILYNPTRKPTFPGDHQFWLNVTSTDSSVTVTGLSTSVGLFGNGTRGIIGAYIDKSTGNVNSTSIGLIARRT